MPQVRFDARRASLQNSPPTASPPNSAASPRSLLATALKTASWAVPAQLPGPGLGRQERVGGPFDDKAFGAFGPDFTAQAVGGFEQDKGNVVLVEFPGGGEARNPPADDNNRFHKRY